MKIISVLFDYSRFEDEENADEINSYFALNVDLQPDRWLLMWIIMRQFIMLRRISGE